MSDKIDRNIADTLDDNKHLIFYKIMKYDVPREYRYFLFEKKWWNMGEDIIRGKKFPPSGSEYPWHKKNPLIDEYVTYIRKYEWLYRSIPFIQSIYLCNSITFNALHEGSDIDLFIVTKKWALWRARIRSAVMFFLFGLKRGGIWGSKKKFCLSFYVTETHQNLYNVMLPQNDIYFIYRLAHLIPLYQETPENIYKYNKRLDSILPNFPWRHWIDIWIKIWHDRSLFKKIAEFLNGWFLGKISETLIRFIRLPIVIYKTKRLKERGWGIIVNKNMLKFHMDIRKKVHLLYMIYKKKYRK